MRAHRGTDRAIGCRVFIDVVHPFLHRQIAIRPLTSARLPRSKIDIPQNQRVIPAGGDQALAIGAEGRAVDPPGVPGERRADLLLRGDIPQRDGLILAGGSHTRAIRAEVQAQHPIAVPSEGRADGPARAQIPAQYRVVGAAGDQRLTIRAEGQAQHPILMANQRIAKGLAGTRVPQSHLAPLTEILIAHLRASAGGQDLRAGREGQAVDRSAVGRGEHPAWLERRRIPDNNMPLGAAGRDPLTVG